MINFNALKVEVESKVAGPDVNEFSVSDAVKIWEINRNTLHEWLKRDLIEPSIEKKSGKGKKIIFNRNDLYRIGLFQIISERGLIRTGARVLVRNLELNKTILS